MELETYRKREQNRVGDSTLNSRMSALRKFRDFIGDKEPEPEDVEEWIDHLIDLHDQGEMKGSTIRQYFKAVRYYFEMIKGEHDNLDYIKRRFPEQDIDHGDFVDEEEWDALRNSIHNYRDKCAVNLMYYYARRPTEIILVNTEDIDYEKDSITFNILKKDKDDHGQKLPTMKLKRNEGEEPYAEHKVFRATFELLPDAKRLISRWMDYRPAITEVVEMEGEEMEVNPLFTTGRGRIKYATIWNTIKSVTEDWDKNITPGSLRHSRVTHLDWEGENPEVIARQQLLHDPDSDVIGSYIHSRDEDQVRTVLGEDDASS